MSWDSYVTHLINDGTCQDAAIAGYVNEKKLWASVPSGNFSKITNEQIQVLFAKERDTLLTNGLTLGLKRCSVLRDCFNVEQDWTMDLRTKAQDGDPPCNITVAKSLTVLVVEMGKEGVHGSRLNKSASMDPFYLILEGFRVLMFSSLLRCDLSDKKKRKEILLLRLLLQAVKCLGNF